MNFEKIEDFFENKHGKTSEIKKCEEMIVEIDKKL